MINICPAILTDDKELFVQKLDAYTKLFTMIDIDINVSGDNFYGNETLNTEAVIEILSSYSDLNLNIHLMIEDPEVEIIKFESLRKLHKIKFFIHQESNLDLSIFSLCSKEELGVAIKADSELIDLDYYQRFSEVQLMTIETGKQGGEFKAEVLERSNKLKDLRFTGIISVDGGVNLESAHLIKNYPIDRVSVGSYFQKSGDIDKVKRELENAFSN